MDSRLALFTLFPHHGVPTASPWGKDICANGKEKLLLLRCMPISSLLV